MASSDRHRKRDFWRTVEEYCEGLSKANGIYVFSLKFGESYTPWYVGKTCSWNGFCQEVLQPHKLAHYNRVVREKRGEPLIHLVARVAYHRGHFTRWSDKADREIDRLESFLIGAALMKNGDLGNDRKTSFQRELRISGVVGDEGTAHYKDSRTLKYVFGF